jgi:hypothetical protein
VWKLRISEREQGEGRRGRRVVLDVKYVRYVSSPDLAAIYHKLFAGTTSREDSEAMIS